MPSSSEIGTARPHATILGAFVEGWRRVLRAPAVTVGVLALTWIVALPLAADLHRAIARALGPSRTADQAVAGWDAEWANEFSADGEGLRGTFNHEILGFGGTLATWSQLLDAGPPLALRGAIAAYLGLWLFLSGGIIDRYARGRRVPISTFFATCGVFFFRFLRMAAVIGTVYWAIFRWLRPWLFGTVFDWGTRTLGNEHQGLVLRGFLYGALLAFLALINLLVDMAKVRAVVEDRHSAIASLLAGARFVRRRAWRCAGLYLLNLLSVVVLARLWMQVAPSASGADWQALLIGQVYLVGRIWARLSFIASEVVFFQGELAHASYAGAPVVRSSQIDVQS